MFKAVSNIKNRKGFTLIELLVVLAILGILAAIAIPGYIGYQKSAKKRASAENWDASVRLVTAELRKCSVDTSTVTTDVIRDLNQGGKKNPWRTTQNAVMPGTSTGPAGTGATFINTSDMQILCNNPLARVNVGADTDATLPDNDVFVIVNMQNL